MKKLLTVALLLMVFQSRSQTFEGTLRWTMKMEFTDPKMKVEMAAAQKQQNDPKRQKEMKEMQEQMNDPEMKKMMESNPQMKAQMEKMMKMSQGGMDPNAMMPKGMIMKIKGDNSISMMEGGMMDGTEVLNVKDKLSVQIDRKNKTYTTLPQGKEGSSQANAIPPKVTKTSETMKILGYGCTKYIVEVMDGGKPSTQFFWTTTDIKDIDMKSLARQRSSRGGQTMYYEQIDGVPMKMEFKSPDGIMVMEVAEIKRESLNASDFTVPSDFKETKMPGMN